MGDHNALLFPSNFREILQNGNSCLLLLRSRVLITASVAMTYPFILLQCFSDVGSTEVRVCLALYRFAHNREVYLAYAASGLLPVTTRATWRGIRESIWLEAPEVSPGKTSSVPSQESFPW